MNLKKIVGRFPSPFFSLTWKYWKSWLEFQRWKKQLTNYMPIGQISSRGIRGRVGTERQKGSKRWSDKVVIMILYRMHQGPMMILNLICDEDTFYKDPFCDSRLIIVSCQIMFFLPSLYTPWSTNICSHCPPA